MQKKYPPIAIRAIITATHILFCKICENDETFELERISRDESGCPGDKDGAGVVGNRAEDGSGDVVGDDTGDAGDTGDVGDGAFANK